MSADELDEEKPAGRLDSGFRFSLAIAIGLMLFIAGLVISLTLGGGASIGLFFGIPLLLAGIAVPLIMMRDQLRQNEVSGACPYCAHAIRTSDATILLICPNCKREVAVREGVLYSGEG